MTQDEMKRLLIYSTDELSRLNKIRHYLNIVIEQLDNPNGDTFSRVELLVSAYISESDAIFDELNGVIRKLKKSCNNKITDD